MWATHSQACIHMHAGRTFCICPVRANVCAHNFMCIGLDVSRAQRLRPYEHNFAWQPALGFWTHLDAISETKKLLVYQTDVHTSSHTCLGVHLIFLIHLFQHEAGVPSKVVTDAVAMFCHLGFLCTKPGKLWKLKAAVTSTTLYVAKDALDHSFFCIDVCVCWPCWIQFNQLRANQLITQCPQSEVNCDVAVHDLSFVVSLEQQFTCVHVWYDIDVNTSAGWFGSVGVSKIWLVL